MRSPRTSLLAALLATGALALSACTEAGGGGGGCVSNCFGTPAGNGGTGGTGGVTAAGLPPPGPICANFDDLIVCSPLLC